MVKFSWNFPPSVEWKNSQLRIRILNVKEERISLNILYHLINDRNAYTWWRKNVYSDFATFVNRLYSINIEEQKRKKWKDRRSKAGEVSRRNFLPPRIRWPERKKRERWKIIFTPATGFEACVTRSKSGRVRRWASENSSLPFPAVQRSNKCRGCCDWSLWDSCCWPAPRYSRSIEIFTKQDRCTVIGPSFSTRQNGLPGRCEWNRAVYEESLCSRGPITIYSPSMFFWVRFAVENNFLPPSMERKLISYKRPD